jgi:hypothetical protein
MSTKQKDSIFGIIITDLFMTKGRESYSRAYISLKVSVFGDSCQRGRKYEPKAKGPHHHQFQKLSFSKSIFNWYLSYCVQKGEKAVFQKLYIKTLLNTKRRISFRGSFCLVKGKAFETGGENFKSWTCFAKSYSFTFDLFAKELWKGFTK